jgi:hypothetical protein
MRRIAFINEKGGTCKVITRGDSPAPPAEPSGPHPLHAGSQRASPCGLARYPAPRGLRPLPLVPRGPRLRPTAALT